MTLSHVSSSRSVKEIGNCVKHFKNTLVLNRGFIITIKFGHLRDVNVQLS